MIRTLIFGAIAGYVGKKLYDEGKLTEFKDDIVSRYDQAKADLAAKKNDTPSTSSVGGSGHIGATPSTATSFNAAPVA
ncbi:hypothetical protein WG907_10700 [Sphingobium sp. AN558]|uniref:hypothetical protein n=1 Tax=Sphingobium sp. AN558 TaxID=3133442 RepID=UPI0030BC5ACB